MLTGKRILITGVITVDSIAFAAAEQAQLAGAEVLLTSFGRARRITERAARQLPHTVDVLELDVNRSEDFESLANELTRRWGKLDGALHAIAYAPDDALSGDFLATPRQSTITAFETSAYSFKALAKTLLPLLRAGGETASLVGLDFDASIAWPSYDWMGVSKAALEAVSRYLARDLGAEGIRVNLVASGPIETLALRSTIPNFKRLSTSWDLQAPLGWEMNNATPVGKAICFLLSDYAQGITGEILHVDGGFHAMGLRLREEPLLKTSPPVEVKA